MKSDDLVLRKKLLVEINEDLHQADLRAEELSQEKKELLESFKTLEANHSEEKTNLEQKQRELLESVKTLDANHSETSEQFENLRRESEQKENERKTRITALEEEKTNLEQQVNSEKEENELLLLQLLCQALLEGSTAHHAVVVELAARLHHILSGCSHHLARRPSRSPALPAR